MSILLTAGDPRRARCGGTRLRVHGCWYDGTAAQFWSRLFDEAAVLCPSATTVRLSWRGDGPLRASQRHPELELAAAADELVGENVGELLGDTLAVLSVVGPPPPVRAQLCDADTVRHERELDRDLVDASLVSFLVTWLLSWAGVPPASWNEARVSGRLAATADSGRNYRFRLLLSATDEHEGLVRRRLELTRDDW